MSALLSSSHDTVSGQIQTSGNPSTAFVVYKGPLYTESAFVHPPTAKLLTAAFFLARRDPK